MAERTMWQNGRQRIRRKNGQYEEIPKCPWCGKRMGLNYASSKWQGVHVGDRNIGGLYAICGKCADRFDAMTEEQILTWAIKENMPRIKEDT
jgi:hypothetical protein